MLDDCLINYVLNQYLCLFFQTKYDNYLIFFRTEFIGNEIIKNEGEKRSTNKSKSERWALKRRVTFASTKAVQEYEVDAKRRQTSTKLKRLQWKKEAPEKKKRRAHQKALCALMDEELLENGLPSCKEIKSSTNLAEVLKNRENVMAVRRILEKFRENSKTSICGTVPSVCAQTV